MAKKYAPKIWSIPLKLTQDEVCKECTPNRVIKSMMLTTWSKLPTVTREIRYQLGHSTRQMWEATWYSLDALVDSVTGQIYIDGKCQSGNQEILP